MVVASLSKRVLLAGVRHISRRMKPEQDKKPSRFLKKTTWLFVSFLNEDAVFDALKDKVLG
ncbi:MAG: hypothetical protein AAB176_11835 [Pseudomonadota bacterium]|jgi:hypothetical protein